MEHIVKVLDANDRGELVNGRLVAPPHDPANVNILNQLNLEARRPLDDDAAFKGWPSPAISSPVIDFTSRSLEDSLSEDEPCVYIEGNNNVIFSLEEKNKADCDASRSLPESSSHSSSSISDLRTRSWGLGQPSYNPNQPPKLKWLSENHAYN